MMIEISSMYPLFSLIAIISAFYAGYLTRAISMRSGHAPTITASASKRPRDIPRTPDQKAFKVVSPSKRAAERAFEAALNENQL